jgi:hypothetical protein
VFRFLNVLRSLPKLELRYGLLTGDKMETAVNIGYCKKFGIDIYFVLEYNIYMLIFWKLHFVTTLIVPGMPVVYLDKI